MTFVNSLRVVLQELVHPMPVAGDNDAMGVPVSSAHLASAGGGARGSGGAMISMDGDPGGTSGGAGGNAGAASGFAQGMVKQASVTA